MNGRRGYGSMPMWSFTAPLTRCLTVIEIRKTEFCLRPLWFWGSSLAVSAHSSRLQCGWPRAYPRSLAPWALLNGLVQPGKHRGLKRDAMIAEAVIRVHVQGGHSGPCVGESGYELFVRGTQSVVGRDIEDRMGGRSMRPVLRRTRPPRLSAPPAAAQQARYPRAGRSLPDQSPYRSSRDHPKRGCPG